MRRASDPALRGGLADIVKRMTTPALRRYDYYKGPERLGELWALTRGALTMRCAVHTHSLGWELKLTAGNFSRAHVCKSEAEAHQTSSSWKTEATAKGWTDPTPNSQ